MDPSASFERRISSPRVWGVDDVADMLRSMREISGQDVRIYTTGSHREVALDELVRLPSYERSSLILRGPELHDHRWYCMLTVHKAPRLLPSSPSSDDEAVGWVNQGLFTLEAVGRPFVQPARRLQLLLGAVCAVLPLTWLLAVVLDFPGWAYLATGSLVVAIASAALYRWVFGRFGPGRLIPVWIRWQLHDRKEIADKRAETRENTKWAAVGVAGTLVTGLIGALVTAVLRLVIP